MFHIKFNNNTNLLLIVNKYKYIIHHNLINFSSSIGTMTESLLLSEYPNVQI